MSAATEMNELPDNPYEELDAIDNGKKKKEAKYLDPVGDENAYLTPVRKTESMYVKPPSAAELKLMTTENQYTEVRTGKGAQDEANEAEYEEPKFSKAVTVGYSQKGTKKCTALSALRVMLALLIFTTSAIVILLVLFFVQNRGKNQIHPSCCSKCD